MRQGDWDRWQATGAKTMHVSTLGSKEGQIERCALAWLRETTLHHEEREGQVEDRIG